MSTKSIPLWQLKEQTQILVDGQWQTVKRIDFSGDNVTLTFADDTQTEPIDNRFTIDVEEPEPETSQFSMWS